MINTTETSIPGIGVVTFRRSLRARYLRITVQPVRGIQVVLPPGVSLKTARDFFQTKKDWVMRQLQRQKEIRKRQRLLLSSAVPVDHDRAGLHIASRLEALASQYGFTYNKASIRNQKTCWGSCSRENNISLNIQLARLPAELTDYVILHELLHTRIKSHEPVFWEALEKVLPGAKRRARELKGYPLELFSDHRE